MGPVEGKTLAMTAALSATLRWICRAAIGLLLTLAAATPSFAEVGCFEDELRHGQEAAATVQDGDASAPAEGGDDQRSDRPAHCSFSHCPQWVPVAPPPRASLTYGFAEQIYPPFVARRHSQSARDGPERPPRA